jgi:hypothetical protein
MYKELKMVKLFLGNAERVFSGRQGARVKAGVAE